MQPPWIFRVQGSFSPTSQTRTRTQQPQVQNKRYTKTPPRAAQGPGKRKKEEVHLVLCSSVQFDGRRAFCTVVHLDLSWSIFWNREQHPPQVVTNSRRRRRSRRISGAWSLSIQKARPSSLLVKTESKKPIYHAWMEKSLSLPSLCSPTPAPINVILNSSRTLILR